MWNSKSLLFVLSVCLTQGYAKIIFDTVHNTCGSNGAPSGSDLLGDVTSMASKAKSAMDAFDAGTLGAWDRYGVAALYDAFFDSTLSGSVSNWNTVKQDLGTMANLGSSSPNVWIQCDDSAVWTESGSNLIFSDPANNGKQTTFAKSQMKRCQDPAIVNGEAKYLIGYRMSVDNVNFITLCLKKNSGDALIKNLSYKEGDDLGDQTTMSTTLFHEMSHAAIPSMRGDLSGGVSAGGERYGWAGAQEVRSTYATQNPDSLTLFALAFSMSEYFWDTGIAESKATRYARLQQNSPQVIQTWGLTSP